MATHDVPCLTHRAQPKSTVVGVSNAHLFSMTVVTAVAPRPHRGCVAVSLTVAADPILGIGPLPFVSTRQAAGLPTLDDPFPATTWARWNGSLHSVFSIVMRSISFRLYHFGSPIFSPMSGRVSSCNIKLLCPVHITKNQGPASLSFNWM